VLLIVGLVLLFVLPSPWNAVALLTALLLWLGEVYGIWRLVRHHQVQAGAETMVGRTATVIAACNPVGQVRFPGESEIWRARCAEGAEVGETVRVVGIDEITLVVERSDPA
jgi:membrane protein implicated in regulation of membrane protease activity